MIETLSDTVKMDVTDVMCPRCRAVEGLPCTNAKGEPTNRSHSERVEFRDYFVDRATGDTETARWWRFKLRNEGPSRPKMGCGTDAGYARHLRAKEKPCEPCAAAHREKVRVAQRERRARIKAQS